MKSIAILTVLALGLAAPALAQSPGKPVNTTQATKTAEVAEVRPARRGHRRHAARRARPGRLGRPHENADALRRTAAESPPGRRGRGRTGRHRRLKPELFPAPQLT